MRKKKAAARRGNLAGMTPKDKALMNPHAEEMEAEFTPQADDGCWVIMTKKLPIDPKMQLPLLSIHWTVAWPQWEFAKSQLERLKHYKLDETASDDLLTDHWLPDAHGMGWEPIWAKARRVLFKGEAIRIFPHEFTVLSMEHMQLYLLGGGVEPPYELVLSNTASDERIGEEIKNGSQRVLYEQALTDGCDHDLAVLTALGVDVTAQVEFPAVGWYRLKSGYAEALGVA